MFSPNILLSRHQSAIKSEQTSSQEPNSLFPDENDPEHSKCWRNCGKLLIAIQKHSCILSGIKTQSTITLVLKLLEVHAHHPWKRNWQPTPVFLPGKSHGQGSLVAYSPWGRNRVICNLVTKQQLNPLPYFCVLVVSLNICEPQSAAAAAKSLQSCPTLCDPIDGSPPGSPVPGILQARTLEWVAISFSNE